MIRFFLLQRLKEHIQGGLKIIVILSGPAVLDHIHDHLQILFLRRGLMEQIQDEGGVQGNLGFLPERVVVGGIFRRGVLNQIVHQFHGVLVVLQVWERVEGVGVVGVNEVKRLDNIAFFQEQRSHGPHRFPLGVRDQKTAIRLHEIGLAEKPCLARAGAADDDLQEVAAVYLSVEAHADISREDGILKGCLVPVLAVEQFWTAPLGGAVFLAGSPVFPGGAVERHGEAVDQQGPQHKLRGVRRPADGKGPLQQFAETAHEVKDSHTLLIAGGQEGRQIEDRQGERRPHERAYGVISTHRAAPLTAPARAAGPVWTGGVPGLAPPGRGKWRYGYTGLPPGSPLPS